MSIFGEEITLENPRDAGNAVEGMIKKSEVHRLTVKALVDTCAWTLVINEETREKLGLQVLRLGTSEAADGVVVNGSITEGVTIYWQDRYTCCNAFVLPNEKAVLLGALPLEGMDVMVDPKRERLIGAHGDQPLRLVK
jgi:predicted aspartyl protease